MGRRINHPHRNKTLYILRGLPGTGKTEKARDIKRRYGGVIISADDYHRNRNGELHIRPENLNDGHIRAREQALQAMDQGLDPVIIDNTNMSWQEMFPYVVMGFYRGYWITFILRIDTFHVSLDEIVRRCPNIPRGKLKRMKKRYQTVKHVYQILWDDDCNWKYRSSIDSWKP